MYPVVFICTALPRFEPVSSFNTTQLLLPFVAVFEVKLEDVIVLLDEAVIK